MDLRKFTTALILIGICASASMAAVTAPEIDGASGVNAVALIAGALLVIRSRKK